MNPPSREKKISLANVLNEAQLDPTVGGYSNSDQCALANDNS